MEKSAPYLVDELRLFTVDEMTMPIDDMRITRYWGTESAEIKTGLDMRKHTMFTRAFHRNLTIGERFSKGMALKVVNALSIESLRVAPALPGVLSDVVLQSEPLTSEGFDEFEKKPIGYNAFTEFKVGEYEYQDAYYMLLIRKNNLAANPLISNLKIHVDVDDVKDRGTAQIPAEETKVYFNRNYYTDPDIVVNVVGGIEGDVVIPYITGIGTDDAGKYFSVVLKNTAGEVVSGSIMWNSNGY